MPGHVDLDRGSIAGIEKFEKSLDRHKTGHRARARQATVWRNNKNRAGRMQGKDRAGHTARAR